MPNNKMFTSRFICLKCLKENQLGKYMIRNKRQREKFHIKHLYCILCREITPNVEIRYNDDMNDIIENLPYIVEREKEKGIL